MRPTIDIDDPRWQDIEDRDERIHNLEQECLVAHGIGLALKHIESQIGIWPADSISPDNLLKQLASNVRAMKMSWTTPWCDKVIYPENN